MGTRMPHWPASWSGYGGGDDDILEDYHNSGPWIVTSRHPASPLGSHHDSSVEPRRTYPGQLLANEDSQLLHPHPEFVSHPTFMAGHEDWRRSSLPNYSDIIVGSSTISSSWSDQHLSPDTNSGSETGSSSVLPETISHTCGEIVPPCHPLPHTSMGHVAMYEVQTLADNPPDTSNVVYIDGSRTGLHGAYGTHMVEDGYQPLEPDQDDRFPSTYASTPNSSEYQPQGTSRHKSEEREEEPVQIRRRRAPSSTTITSIQKSATRVNRRPQHKRHDSSYRSNKSPDDSNGWPVSTKKDFLCAFAPHGCYSSFGNKNEWKRHVHTQHLRLSYWRCEQCADSDNGRKPNDFNRRDLFVQHVRRMHPFAGHVSSRASKEKSIDEEQYLNDEASRCYRQLRRAPPSSRCLMCDQHFQGESSWEQRMEHVGRHFEECKTTSSTASQDPQQWHVDRDLEQYLRTERIVVEGTRGLVLPEYNDRSP